jgi:hypothetical protein
VSERCGFVTLIGIAAGTGKFGVATQIAGRLYNALCVIVTLRSNSDITLQKHAADRTLDTGGITCLGTSRSYVRNLLVSMTDRNKHYAGVIRHELSSLLVKEPLTASANVIFLITVLRTGRIVSEEMGHIFVLVSKLGCDNVFANGTKLCVFLCCFLAGNVRHYLITSTTYGTNVIVTLFCLLVSYTKGMSESRNVRGLNVCTERAGSLGVTARITGRSYGLADVLVRELVLGNHVLVVTVDTTVNRTSLAMAGSRRIAGEHVIVSGCRNNGLKRGSALCTGVLNNTVLLTGSCRSHLADPLVTKCRSGLDDLITT